MRLFLTGGAYSARSIIANSQRCVNLYPERNPKDSPVPVTHYQRPGLLPLVQGPVPGPVRGLYRASNGQGYCVIGQGVYQITGSWVLRHLGDLAGARTNLVSIIDNGVTLVLADGSNQGYQISLASGAFTTIIDPTGTFQGSVRFDTIDGFVIWPMGGTQWGSTLNGAITFNGTFVSNKSGYPDPLATLVVVHHEVVLLGALKSEIWYDAGGTSFPFAEIPGAYIEHGIVATYSAAAMDGAVYWLGQDLQGDGVVYRQRGYETRRISNHALEVAIGRIKKLSGSITDAIAYTYQQDGHFFYVLTFPTGDQTWVWDESIGDPETGWHQRAWTDAAGVLHRERANCYAFINGTCVVGDWQNGTLYALDLDVYADTVGGVTLVTDYIRTFPHLMAGVDPRGQPQLSDGKLVEHNEFVADIECGLAPADSTGATAQVQLRWSDDRGRTWGNTVLQVNPFGQYLTMPKWAGLGQARDRVYEIYHNFNGPGALNGAWVNGKVLEQ